MQDLYKFIDENTVKKYKNGFIILDNMIHANPDEDTLKSAGYKPLVDNIPEINDNQYLTRVYQDDEDCITAVYTINEIEEIDPGVQEENE